MTQAKPPRPLLLAILDGLALNPRTEGNAVEAADTPVLDRLLRTCPHTTLCTFGPRVGLPEGQMGNSEVGHLNIGAGRIVEQELSRINRVLSEGGLDEIAAFNNLCKTVAASDGAALHLIGLTSLGGVHSQRSHLESLILEALRCGVRSIYVHAITDGRDRPPTASLEEVTALERFIAEQCRPKYPGADVAIVSFVGRYFAMDRDNRWERTERAYRLFTEGVGEEYASLEAGLAKRIADGETDEFYEPSVLAHGGRRTPWIKDGDAILLFNFRADRMRQIVTTFFAGDEFDRFDRAVRPKLSAIASLTEYDADFPLEVLFRPQQIKNHLGELVSAAGLSQLRIAETEKYPHVTYFFSGGSEDALRGEERILIPSPRDVPTYDKKPQMSALEVTDALIERIKAGAPDFIVLNFANCDMVGHTGVFEAAVEAVSVVDRCLGRVLDAVLEQGGAALVTADHGNADQMIDYLTGKPHTYHTTHPVPLLLVGAESSSVTLEDGGALCDIAPTICTLLRLAQPAEMTGRSLIRGG